MSYPLDTPVKRKHSETGGNARLLYGISEMQGWRPYVTRYYFDIAIAMEDAHTAILDLDEGKEVSNMFFAVYDGHTGSEVAKYAAAKIPKLLVDEENYKRGYYTFAMKGAFLRADDELYTSDKSPDFGGCTAIAALVTSGGRIYVANAGDCRCVISVKGEAKPLSDDHKPNCETERERIYAAGGYVSYDNRVNGHLSLSRAIGDFAYKRNRSLRPEEQAITANPDVIMHLISEEDEFFIIACDGIWDGLSSQEAVDFVRREVAQGKELTEICESICDHCLAPSSSNGEGPIGCDNMTIMIIAILHGRTKEGWYEWVKDRFENKYGYPTPEVGSKIRFPSAYTYY